MEKSLVVGEIPLCFLLGEILNSAKNQAFESGYFKSAPSTGFCVFICFVKGSEYMDAPFFLKGQYIEEVTRENLFFPWRSTMRTYDPL